jgi:TRAP-type C4-dicarboxylate transport system substrate-binding protein
MTFSKVTASLAIAAALASLGQVAHGADLQIQTSTQSGEFSFAYLRDQWAQKLAEMSGGNLNVEFMPIESVMPRNETPEGVSAGVLSGDLTSISYFSGRDPAFAILGDLIAGYDTPYQIQDFCREGGGTEAVQALWDEIMPGMIHVVGCGAVSKEALVSKVPIRGFDDLKGIKVRSPEGLAATVFKDAGASPVNIPFSEVFTSLEKGVVDAADASAYSNNDAGGYHQIAKYPLYPGIHSMAVHQFTINQSLWDSMSAEDQQALQTWFYDAYKALAQALDAEDQRLVARDKAAGDIEVIDWSQEDRDRFRAVATSAWEATAAKSPAARAALDTQLAYMKKIGLLKE